VPHQKPGEFLCSVIGGLRLIGFQADFPVLTENTLVVGLAI